MAYLGFSTHSSSSNTKTHKTLPKTSLPSLFYRQKSIFLSEATDCEECGGKTQGCKRKTNECIHKHTNRVTSDFSLSGWFVKLHSGVKSFLSFFFHFQPQSEQQNRIIIFLRHKIKYLPHNLQHCYLPFTENGEEKNMRILMALG